MEVDGRTNIAGQRMRCLAPKKAADERLITTENSMHWTDKEVRKVSVHWALIMVLYRGRGTINDHRHLLFGSVWSRSKCGNHHPNAVTTIVAPGVTELHLVQLLSQLRQLNSDELELTQLSGNTTCSAVITAFGSPLPYLVWSHTEPNNSVSSVQRASRCHPLPLLPSNILNPRAT